MDFSVTIEDINRDVGLTIKCSPARSHVSAQDAEITPYASIRSKILPQGLHGQEISYRCTNPSRDDDGLDVLKFYSVPPPGHYQLVVRYQTSGGGDVWGSTHFQLKAD